MSQLQQIEIYPHFYKLAIGSAYFALIAIQIILYGLDDDVTALNIEGPSALHNKTCQPVIQILT